MKITLSKSEYKLLLHALQTAADAHNSFADAVRVTVGEQHPDDAKTERKHTQTEVSILRLRRKVLAVQGQERSNT